MSTHAAPIAIVGVGAILPDAPDAVTFWKNIAQGRYSVSEVQADRWDADLYFDDDHKAPGKTYSKIGGWVREWEWEPMQWHFPIPPKVGDSMDDAQKWAVACTHAALADYGWPERTIDTEHTAVILGNAMGGEKHYQTALRIAYPELARELDASPSFFRLPADVARLDPRRLPRTPRSPHPRHHRRHHARRAGQLHRRPHCQPVRPSRPQLHRRRRLRIGNGGVRCIDRRPLRRRVRRRDQRWHRPQHGPVDLRQVLQDRGTVGHRHTAVRRGRRWVRDGRGRGPLRAQATGRRGARRRPHLRGRAWHRWCQRRARQRHHRAQPRRPAARRGAGLAQRRGSHRRLARWSRPTARRRGSATSSRSTASPTRSRRPTSSPVPSLSAR